MRVESQTGTSVAIDEGAGPIQSAPDINNIRPFSAEDIPCLSDIRSVLEKHGLLGRFAVQLRHQHFDLGENEALLESVQGRTLNSFAVGLEEIILEEGEGLMVTSVDLLEEPSEKSLAQMAGRPLCRYVYVDTPRGPQHQHVRIFD